MLPNKYSFWAYLITNTVCICSFPSPSKWTPWTSSLLHTGSVLKGFGWYGFREHLLNTWIWHSRYTEKGRENNRQMCREQFLRKKSQRISVDQNIQCMISHQLLATTPSVCFSMSRARFFESYEDVHQKSFLLQCNPNIDIFISPKAVAMVTMWIFA